MHVFRRHRAALLCAAFAASASLLVHAPAHALDEVANEKEKLKACEKHVCEAITKKEASGADLACTLSKTWGKDKIKEGIEKKKITWSLGDARCGLDLALSRASVVDALTKPDHTIEFAKHTVKCEVEREKEITPIQVTLQPKITFKGGKATKALLGVTEIEAPAVVKGAIWTAAKVEDTIGLFHSDMVAEINEFIEKKCPKAMAGN